MKGCSKVDSIWVRLKHLGRNAVAQLESEWDWLLSYNGLHSVYNSRKEAVMSHSSYHGRCGKFWSTKSKSFISQKRVLVLWETYFGLHSDQQGELIDDVRSVRNLGTVFLPFGSKQWTEVWATSVVFAYEILFKHSCMCDPNIWTGKNIFALGEVTVQGLELLHTHILSSQWPWGIPGAP